MTITPEDAVTLAEWIGWHEPTQEQMDGEFRRIDNKPGEWLIHPNGDYFAKSKFPDWLRSPEGQEALMDRLINLEYKISFENLSPLHHCPLIHCRIDMTVPPLNQLICKTFANAKTRQDALIQVCLVVQRSGKSWDRGSMATCDFCNHREPDYPTSCEDMVFYLEETQSYYCQTCYDEMMLYVDKEAEVYQREGNPNFGLKNMVLRKETFL